MNKRHFRISLTESQRGLLIGSCGFLAFVYVLLSVVFRDNQAISGIQTEIIGACLTILIFEALAIKAQNQDQRMHESLALKRLRRPLRSIIRMWMELANNGRVVEVPDLREHMLSIDFYYAFKWTDFARPIRPGTRRTRKREVPKILDSFEQRLILIEQVHISSLDYEKREVFEFFIDPKVHLKVKFYLGTILDARFLVAASQITLPQFREYVNKLMNLVEFHNEVCELEDRIDGKSITKLESFD